jgi:sugar phosphate isomerase/epimerase
MIVSNATPLGLAHFTTIDVEPAALVAMAAGIGYSAVGLRLFPPFPGAPCYEIPVDSEAMRLMRALLADTGVTVWDIEFLTLDENFEIETIRPVLDSAAALGARRISACGNDPDRTRLGATLGLLCEAVGAVGLAVDLEVMPWRQVSSLAIAGEVIERAGRPNAGLLVDALHLSRSGSSPASLRAMPRERIRSAQLCDAVAERPATTVALIREARSGRLLPGDGALPLRQLVAELPDHAVLSVEVPNTGHPPEEHARRVYDATRRVLAA